MKWLIWLVIIIVVVGGYFLLKDGEVEMDDKSINVSELLPGTWQSADDENYSVAFNSNGSVQEAYASSETEPVLDEGSWELKDEVENVGDLEGPFLVKMLNGEEFVYAIFELTEESLVLNFLDRGNTLTFERISNDEEIPVDGLMEMEEFTLVDYTDEGFVPKEVIVKKGGTVRFVNNSSGGMWVGSALHPTHAVYPEKSDDDCLGSSFDQCEEVPAGSFWEFTFNSTGSHGYHNHVKASDFGKVIVE